MPSAALSSPTTHGGSAGGARRARCRPRASIGICTLAAALISVTGDTEPDWIPKRAGVAIDQSGSGSRTRRSKWEVLDGYVELHLAMGPAVGSFTNSFFTWMRDEGALPDGDIASWDWRSLPTEIAAGRIGTADMDRARAMVAAFLAGKTKEEVTAAALARKLLSVGVADAGDLVESKHFADRGFLVTVPGPGGRSRLMPGPLAAVSGAYAPVHAAPGRGPDGAAADPITVPDWATRATPSWAQDSAANTSSPGSGLSKEGPIRPPFESLKVADLSWVVAGPVIGRALADFGATVVRVESGAKVETARHMPPYYGGTAGVENSALYINCNAGKLGLALDLSRPESRRVVLRLAEWADVLVKSYTPGQMGRWGLGYEVLSTTNPRLIMLSSSLMGQSGRLSRLAGFGNIGAALSGFQHIVGWPDRPPLGPFGPYTDYVGPKLALVALLAALEHRSRTGAGCYLDVSQAECGAWFLAPQIAACAATGEIAQRRGNRDPSFAPHGVFPCRPERPGGADHVAIAARDTQDFRALMAVIERPDLAADRALQTLEGRQAREDELEAAIEDWTRHHQPEEIERLCQQAGVPAHRAARSSDFIADDQLVHLGHLRRLAHPLHGEVVVEGPRYMLSATPGRVEKAAPLIGQDSEAVLRLIGLDDDEITELEKAGVLR